MGHGPGRARARVGTYARRVPTVDRMRWVHDRLAFLQETLDGGVSDEQRSAIEEEMAGLHKELGGPASRWLRRLFGIPRSR